MKVHEVASLLDTTDDTVRYYTRLCLLNPVKADNGYKHYSDGDINRLRFILAARTLGFTVDDISKILSESDSGRSPCKLTRTLIQKRLEETERQFNEVLRLRNRMKKAVQKWSEMPDGEPCGENICHLIETFDE